MIEYDYPLFKVLAKNDTGEAKGHQAGFVVPKDLDSYFPQLSKKSSALSPTASENLKAMLFDGYHFLRDAEPRYQYQTWGGTRSPERRVTNDISDLRNLAVAGDIMLMQRGLADPLDFRLQLVRQGTKLYGEINALVGKRRWGVLDRKFEPVKETEVDKEIDNISEKEVKPFVLFDGNPDFQETRGKKIARSRAFSSRISEIYLSRCAVCEKAFVNEKGSSETDAAHIVPRGKMGSDDPRNGLSLCKSHHWAFDMGIFSFDGSRQLILSNSLRNHGSNADLDRFVGKPHLTPIVSNLLPDISAIKWHRENTFVN